MTYTAHQVTFDKEDAKKLVFKTKSNQAMLNFLPIHHCIPEGRERRSVASNVDTCEGKYAKGRETFPPIGLLGISIHHFSSLRLKAGARNMNLQTFFFDKQANASEIVINRASESAAAVNIRAPWCGVRGKRKKRIEIMACGEDGERKIDCTVTGGRAKEGTLLHLIFRRAISKYLCSLIRY